MDVRELLRTQADQAFRELKESIHGVSQELAWARATLQPDEYLHTEGSILSLVVHIAGCKFIYGSAAYRDLEIRWRHVVERFDAFWPDWAAAQAFLEESHAYFLQSWESETDFERLVMSFREQERPSWWVVSTVIHHDMYHAGQIQMLRATLAPTDVPPPSEAEDWKLHCEPTGSW